MKNLHIIPTDKPSMLYSKDGNHKLKLANSTMAMDWYISSAGYKPINIYITSDEDIKEGDKIYSIEFDKIFTVKSFYETILHEQALVFLEGGLGCKSKCKKIILTTDQDLIKDGVQAIDDEFLEWFVKNPSCGYVEVKLPFTPSSMVYGINTNLYEIIITKEESKQVLGYTTKMGIKITDEFVRTAMIPKEKFGNINNK